ncbi:unnamed protein product, partial [Leptidea sinapis]
YTY